MVYTGVVKDGKIELPEGVCLPEGQQVLFQLHDESWDDGWDKLADDVTASWRSEKSKLELLNEGRRCP